MRPATLTKSTALSASQLEQFAASSSMASRHNAPESRAALEMRLSAAIAQRDALASALREMVKACGPHDSGMPVDQAIAALEYA